ncbi:MAG: hypothetical protein ACXVLQ_16235 [Bacteriovorax sp.]
MAIGSVPKKQSEQKQIKKERTPSSPDDTTENDLQNDLQDEDAERILNAREPSKDAHETYENPEKILD